VERKIKLTIACWGTVVAIAILCSALLIFLGMGDKIKIFFYLHFSIGALIIFLIFWPFYSKRMK
jgi:hypothetical protein